MNKQDINARLEAVREQLEAAAVEVGEITNAAPYRFGSRVSYVTDRIKQAVEDITACIDYPPYSWRIDETEQAVTVWEDFAGVGFTFQKGDPLAARNYTITRPVEETAEGSDTLDGLRAEFLKYARANYPAEFGNLNA